MRAKWYLHALPHYNVVFTPRRSNIEDMLQLGCREVRYLPFGYDEFLFDSSLGRATADPRQLERHHVDEPLHLLVGLGREPRQHAHGRDECRGYRGNRQATKGDG